MGCLECVCMLSATERGAHVLQSIGPSLRSSVSQGIGNSQFHTAFLIDIFHRINDGDFCPKS